MSEDRPQIVVTVAAPVEAVWDALRDKQKIRHWHGWEYEGPEGGLDEEIDLIYFTRAVEEGTTLTLGADPKWEAYYDDVTEGWTTFLNQLRFAVERHPGEARHTLFYSGTGPVSPMAELGISPGSAGSSYELELMGEQAKGEFWYTSEHQIGLTVDAWGNGLLVLSHIPPGDQKPDGATMAVLSLYGDTDRTELDARWRAWWEPRYPDKLDLGG